MTKELKKNAIIVSTQDLLKIAQSVIRIKILKMIAIMKKMKIAKIIKNNIK